MDSRATAPAVVSFSDQAAGEVPGSRMEQRIAARAARQKEAAAPAAVQPPPPPGIAPVRTQTFSFDDAHPARADEHYLRTSEQDEALRHAEEALANSRALRASTGTLRPASAHGARRPATATVSRRARGAGGARARPLSASYDAGRPRGGDASEYVDRLERVVNTLTSSFDGTSSNGASGQSLGARIASLEQSAAHLRSSADAGERSTGPALADHLAENSGSSAPSTSAQATEEASLADHLASSGPSAEEVAREALAQEAQDAVAHARYERERYDAYLNKLNAVYERQLEMGGPAVEDEEDYDEESRIAALQRKALAEQHAAEAEAEAAAAEERERNAGWEEQNEWMDEYRTGRRDARTHATRSSRERDATFDRIAAEAATGIEAARGLAVQARMELGDSGAIPAGYGSEGEQSSGVYYDASGNRRIRMKKPFSFVDRPKKKTISQVKMEQDLVLKRMAEEAELSKRFIANDVPYSSRDRNRYERLEYERYMRSLKNKEKAQATLLAGEKTFTFWARDMEKIEERKHISEKAADERAKRFQRSFKAKDPPSTTHGNLWDKQMRREEERQTVQQRRREAYEARRVAAAAAGDGASSGDASSTAAPGSKMEERIAARKARSDSSRPQTFVRAFKARDPPDWKRVHERMALKDLERRSRIQITQPEEFPQGGSRLFESKQSAYEAEFGKPANRPYDDPNLAELRFPYTVGARSKVLPTPPPKEDDTTKLARQQEYETNMNHAARLRVKTVERQRRAGKFDSTEEREKRAQDEEKALVRRRKKLTEKMMNELARRRGPGDDFMGDTAAGTYSAAGKGSSWEEYAPYQHMDALRNQAAKEGEALVREVLEDVGALKYVEDNK
ncbi:hypothetical protein NFJ02_09g143490 [Pycnococcus provasolii]